MKRKTVFMFPGQGSQYYHMGRLLFDQHPVFREWMIAGDKLYQELTHTSLLSSLYNPEYSKSQTFARTLLTHPAIFVIEHALGQLLLSKNITPDIVLGVSLGEFSAAVFAGVMTFTTALQAVVSQATFLEAKCPSGQMMAILYPFSLYQHQYSIFKNSELAAYNFASHFVVSAQTHEICSIQNYLKQQNIASQTLAVSQAFHSSYIDAAASPFLDFIYRQPIKTPTIPYVSCIYPQQVLTFIPSSHFWDIARQPIQFMATIQHMEKEGSYEYIDVSPSGTLATFVKYILTSNSYSRPSTLITPMKDDLQTLEKCPIFDRS